MPDNTLHTVTLNYTEISSGVPRVAQPPTIRVGDGHRIRFIRGAIPPGLTFTIAFAEPQFFSTAGVDEGGQDVHVVAALPHRTSYRCGLKGADGQVVPGSWSGPAVGSGGDIDPIGGN